MNKLFTQMRVSLVWLLSVILLAQQNGLPVYATEPAQGNEAQATTQIATASGPTETQVQRYPVRVLIKEVHATNRFDGPCNIFWCDNADFFAVVTIDGQQSTTNAVSNADNIAPNWRIDRAVSLPDEANDAIPIQIMIRDSDDCGTTPTCGNEADLTANTADRPLNLVVDLSNCAAKQGEQITGSVTGACAQTIVAAGATGPGTENTAEIHFVIEVDAPGTAPGAFFPNPGQLWHPFFCIDNEVCRTGDFNGDGRSDVATFLRSTKTDAAQGDVWVALSSGTNFATATIWHDSFCLGNESCLVGDFNGDGRDDIAAFVQSTQSDTRIGDVWVALSTGSAFAAATRWHDFFCVGAEVCAVGDFNGDGRADIATFIRSSKGGAQVGDVWVAPSNGAGFAAASIWHETFCVGDELCAVGDFNGDGRADIAAFVRNSQSGDGQGDVWVALSSGTAFGVAARWHEFFCIGQEVCAVGDFNGDGQDDIITFLRDTQSDDTRGDVYVALSFGTAFGGGWNWHNLFCVGQELCATGDFNGDGGSDITTFLGNTQGGDLQGDVYVALTADVQTCTDDQLTITYATPILPNQNVTFTANCLSGKDLTYQWTFSDGSVKTGSSVTHSFTRSGRASVTVVAEKGAQRATRTNPVQVNYVIYLPLLAK